LKALEADLLEESTITVKRDAPLFVVVTNIFLIAPDPRTPAQSVAADGKT